MNNAGRKATLWYGAGLLLLVVALVWLTGSVLRRERLRAQAQAEALHHEDLRTALWRMESRLGVLLASATSSSKRQPPADPAGFSNAWIDPKNLEANAIEPPESEIQERLIAAADAAFERLDRGRVPAAQSLVDAGDDASALSKRGHLRSQMEYAQRADSNVVNRLQNVSPSDPTIEMRIGPLAATWEGRTGTGSDGRPEFLYLSRRIESSSGPQHDVYRLSWSDLEPQLLEEIVDLFPGARLVPIEQASIVDDGVAQLAAIPARLEVMGRPEVSGLSRWFLLTLGSTWVAALAAFVGVGHAVRASVAYGEKHRRFTYAVTHELRTPLTTFRMYSEMLAKDMVPPDSRAEYLATLEGEAARLSALVENVLGYARLEDRHAKSPRERVTARELLERCRPALDRTCAAAGARLELELDVPEELELDTNVGGIEQVLTNLVDNACKYGCPATGSPVRVEMRALETSLVIEVSDQGNGVPEHVARAIFRPFERGGRDSSDPAPGVGLGLALATGLVQELGGQLTLVGGKERGATFRVSLPLPVDC